MTKPGARRTRPAKAAAAAAVSTGASSSPPAPRSVAATGGSPTRGWCGPCIAESTNTRFRLGFSSAQPQVVTAGTVFTVSGLDPNLPYHYTINPVGGPEFTYSDVTTDVDGVFVADVTGQMLAEPSGDYEFAIYGDDEWDATAHTGLADANPALFLFQYLAPPVTTTPPPPPSTVRLDRAAAVPTPDEVLSTLVLSNTTARSFALYDAFVNERVCRRATVFAPNAYQTLVDATREFLAVVRQPVGLPVDAYLQNGRLPYIDDIAQRFPDALTGDICSDLDPDLFDQPFPVELIWSYWHEEGGLVQTLNHILARFQNRRISRLSEPLARFDLSPLRPLRHLLFSWGDDEINRLTVRRRDAEYANEYGLHMIGRAIPTTDLYVEQRTQFLESFHTLLFEAHRFFVADDDATMNADAFPVLNSLRDTHLVLAEGALNQFGDLPTTAREQMLIMQWLLRQPEMRDFLGGRPMTPYREPWMDRVDTMKTISGWIPTSITYFNEMAVIGEQLLLTIRYGNWNDPLLTAESAKNWARTWRSPMQRYVHAYRSATGVDLASGVDATMPAKLLARRAPTQARRA